MLQKATAICISSAEPKFLIPHNLMPEFSRLKGSSILGVEIPLADPTNGIPALA